MNALYNKYRVQVQNLLAVCQRNLKNFDAMDKEIVRAESALFYSGGCRGLKRGASHDQK